MTDFISGWDQAAGSGDWVFQPIAPRIWTDEAGAPVIDHNGLLVGAIIDETTTLDFINDLTTAVLISLFTDAAAGVDDAIPDGSGNRRGWWGDPAMGSKIWLLERSKALPSVADRAVGYAQDALAWLVGDGIAQRIEATAEWVNSTMLVLTIKIVRGTANSVSIRFANLWDFI